MPRLVSGWTSETGSLHDNLADASGFWSADSVVRTVVSTCSVPFRASPRSERFWDWLSIGCLFAQQSFAEHYDQGPVFSVIEENDLFANTDRHYTQGIKLSFLQRDGDLPAWAKGCSEMLPAWGFDRRVVKFGYQIGQSIFTPSDISQSKPPKDDRPYAGWLYARRSQRGQRVVRGRTPYGHRPDGLRLEGGFAMTYRTREFKDQEDNRYGSLFHALDAVYFLISLRRA
jgi:hypothetical protein